MKTHRQNYMDANTRRYPRTLSEAFGPYTSNEIQEPRRPMDWQDKVVLGASLLLGAFTVGLILTGGGV